MFEGWTSSTIVLSIFWGVFSLEILLKMVAFSPRGYFSVVPFAEWEILVQVAIVLVLLWYDRRTHASRLTPDAVAASARTHR